MGVAMVAWTLDAWVTLQQVSALSSDRKALETGAQQAKEAETVGWVGVLRRSADPGQVGRGWGTEGEEQSSSPGLKRQVRGRERRGGGALASRAFPGCIQMACSRTLELQLGLSGLCNAVQHWTFL